MPTGNELAVRAGRHWLVPGLLAALTSALTLAAGAQGPGLSTDSVTYLSSGIRLARGFGLTGLAGSQMTEFPPGLPLVAAAGESLGGHPRESVLILNALCAGAIVVLTHAHLTRVLPRRAWVIGLTAWVAVSPDLVKLCSMAWTEPLFLVAVLLILLVLVDSTEHVTFPRIAALVVLCWLAFAFRYVGLWLVPFCASTLLATQWRRSRAAALRAALLTGLGGAALPFAWMLRNDRIDGHWFAARPGSIDTPKLVLSRLAHTAGVWAVPRLPDLLTRALGAVVGLAGVALIMWSLAATRRRRGPKPAGVAAVHIHVAFIAYFVGALCVAQLTTGFNPIDGRLLSPVYVSVVVVLGWCITRLTTDGLGKAIAATALLAVTVIRLVDTADYVVASARNGIGYNTTEWLDSEVSAAVVADTSAHGSTPTLWMSNDTGAMWSATGKLSMLKPPQPGGSVPTLDVAWRQLDESIACSDRARFAWYENSTSPTFTLDELRTNMTLSLIATYDDGAVYAVSTSSTCPAGATDSADP